MLGEKCVMKHSCLAPMEGQPLSGEESKDRNLQQRRRCVVRHFSFFFIIFQKIEMDFACIDIPPIRRAVSNSGRWSAGGN